MAKAKKAKAKKAKRRVDRSSVQFVAARRIARGVDVSAIFVAAKSRGGRGHYKVQMLIDAKTKNVVRAKFVMRHRKTRGYVAPYIPSAAIQRQLAQELRDIFVELPAWPLLKDRAPDLDYVVDPEGNERVRPSLA